MYDDKQESISIDTVIDRSCKAFLEPNMPLRLENLESMYTVYGCIISRSQHIFHGISYMQYQLGRHKWSTIKCSTKNILNDHDITGSSIYDDDINYIDIGLFDNLMQMQGLMTETENAKGFMIDTP